MWDFVQESYFWILPEVDTKAVICINPVRQNIHAKGQTKQIYYSQTGSQNRSLGAMALPRLRKADGISSVPASCHYGGETMKTLCSRVYALVLLGSWGSSPVGHPVLGAMKT